MTLIIIFFCAGIVLLALEVVLPGAVLGILGALVMLAGCVAAFAHYGAGGGFLSMLAAVLLVSATFLLELFWLPKSRVAKYFSMSTTLEGASQPPLAEESEVLGREAVAETALAPSGYVRVGRRRLEAFSQAGFVRAGEKLTVTGLDNFRVLVTKTTKTNTQTNTPTSTQPSI